MNGNYNSKSACHCGLHPTLHTVPKVGTIVPSMVTPAADRVARLLFGSVRRDVLALLLGRPGERFHLREIIRAAGGASGAVQREVRDLVAAGLVLRETSGRQVYFSANRDSPVFNELRSIIEKTAGTADLLRVALGPLYRRGRIETALIYGSVASGTQTARSDVDLLVIGDASLSEISAAVRRVEAKIGREVNPSVYGEHEFQERLARGTGFLKRIIAGPKLFVVGVDRDLERLAG